MNAKQNSTADEAPDSALTQTQRAQLALRAERVEKRESRPRDRTAFSSLIPDHHSNAATDGLAFQRTKGRKITFIEAKVLRLIDLMIPMRGAQLYRELTGTTSPDEPEEWRILPQGRSEREREFWLANHPAYAPAEDEQPSQEEIRIAARNAALGAALLFAWNNTHRAKSRKQFVRFVEREFKKIVADPPSAAEALNTQLRKREWYYRKRAEQQRKTNERLADGMKDWLRGLSTETPNAPPLEVEEGVAPGPNPEEILLAQEEAQELRSDWLALMTPAEREELEAMLNGEPSKDAAARQRRSRARRKLRAHLEQT